MKYLLAILLLTLGIGLPIFTFYFNDIGFIVGVALIPLVLVYTLAFTRDLTDDEIMYWYFFSNLSK